MLAIRDDNDDDNDNNNKIVIILFFGPRNRDTVALHDVIIVVFTLYIASLYFIYRA